MIAGSENLNGAASSLTDRSGSAASRITNARRVGSDSAPKVRSRAGPKNLTIWFSIKRRRRCQLSRNDESVSVPIHPFLNAAALIGRCMDSTSLISAFIGADVGMMQLGVAAEIARTDVPGTASSVSQLTDAANANAASLANVAAGIGTNLNISA